MDKAAVAKPTISWGEHKARATQGRSSLVYCGLARASKPECAQRLGPRKACAFVPKPAGLADRARAARLQGRCGCSFGQPSFAGLCIDPAATQSPERVARGCRALQAAESQNAGHGRGRLTPRSRWACRAGHTEAGSSGSAGRGKSSRSCSLRSACAPEDCTLGGSWVEERPRRQAALWQVIFVNQSPARAGAVANIHVVGSPKGCKGNRGARQRRPDQSRLIPREHRVGGQGLPCADNKTCAPTGQRQDPEPTRVASCH